MSFKIDTFENELLNTLIVTEKPEYPILIPGKLGASSGSQYSDYSMVPLYNTPPTDSNSSDKSIIIGTANFINMGTSLYGTTFFGKLNFTMTYEIAIFSLPDTTYTYLYSFQYQSCTAELGKTSNFNPSGGYQYDILSASRNKIIQNKMNDTYTIGPPENFNNSTFPNSNSGIGTINVNIDSNTQLRTVRCSLNNITAFYNTFTTVYYRPSDFSTTTSQGATNGYYYPCPAP